MPKNDDRSDKPGSHFGQVMVVMTRLVACHKGQVTTDMLSLRTHLLPRLFRNRENLHVCIMYIAISSYLVGFSLFFCKSAHEHIVWFCVVPIIHATCSYCVHLQKTHEAFVHTR